MAKEYRFRRGTTDENAVFTGASGEITVDTEKNAIIVHDGVTVGGHELLRADQSNVKTGSITLEKLGAGDPNSFIVFGPDGVPAFEPTLDGEFFVQGTVPDTKLVDQTPNTIATVDGSGNVVLRTELSATTYVDAGAITTAKIANLAVTGDKVDNGTITTLALSAGAVTNAKVASDNSVSGSKLANNAVTNTKIVDNTIPQAKIADLSLTGVNFANGAFLYWHWIPGSIDYTRFDPATAGNSRGARTLDTVPPASNLVGNNGDIWYVTD